MSSSRAHAKRLSLYALTLSLVVGSLGAAALFVSRRAPTRNDVRSEASRVDAATPSHDARETYGRIPMSFEANRGQTDESVNFLARGAGYALFLKPTEAVFALHRADASTRKAPTALRMKLVGANADAKADGVDELAGRVNYFVGDDPVRWRTNVPVFGRVRYGEVYSGVDVVYYGNQRQLEYDFRVAPGADARAVLLEFEGAEKVEVNASGELLLTLGESVVVQPKPFVYQEAEGARREVACDYSVEPGGRVRFALGEYDEALPLVIDPTLVYSTYLGGSGGDQAWAVRVDATGNAYIAGFTTSTNFPTANAIQAANGGFQDAFVAKLNAAGTALVYSTYLGGNGRRSGARPRHRLFGQRIRHGLHGLDELPDGERASGSAGRGQRSGRLRHEAQRRRVCSRLLDLPRRRRRA
jgi:hypothetical protein